MTVKDLMDILYNASPDDPIIIRMKSDDPFCDEDPVEFTPLPHEVTADSYYGVVFDFFNK